MTTVTAKQLREDLSNIINRVENGEDIVVIRHSKPAIRLSSESRRTGNAEQVLGALDRYNAYLQASGMAVKTDPDTSVKDLYHEAMDSELKYTGRNAGRPE